MKQNKQTREDEPTRTAVPNAHNQKGQADLKSLYGLAEWTPAQPVTLASDTRLGVLMQPSWLIAWR